MEPTGPEDPTSYTEGFQQGFASSEARYLEEVAQLKAERVELLQALQAVIDGEADLDESTVPQAGPDSDPDRVIYTLRVTLAALRHARILTSDARGAGLI